MRRRLVSILTVLLVALGLAWSGVALAREGENSRGLSVSSGDATIWTDKPAYRVGEDVKIFFKSSQTGYAVIYDYSADGRSQVVWPAGGAPELILAGRTYMLPQGRDRIAASQPVGTDTLVLVVSPVRETFVGSLNISLYITGTASRGLAVGGVAPQPIYDGSFSAQCSFEVLPVYPSNVTVQVDSSGSVVMLGGLLLFLAGAAILAP